MLNDMPPAYTCARMSKESLVVVKLLQAILKPRDVVFSKLGGLGIVSEVIECT